MYLLGVVIAALLSFDQVTWKGVDQRLEKSDPAVALARFANYPTGANKDRFSFNTNFWLKGVDFSCVSPWNSGGGRVRAGTAISKRHIVFAKHFPLWKGVRILFVGEDGGVCPVRIEATKAIEKTDIMIGSLNYELTPNIHPAKILPPDFEKYIGDGQGLPVATFNQHEKVFLTELHAIPTNGSPIRGCRSQVPADRRRAGFRDKIIVGDSGDPAFMLIGNTPILMYCLTGGGCGAGPALHCYRREIQKVMDELCPGYRLECFDFSTVRPPSKDSGLGLAIPQSQIANP